MPCTFIAHIRQRTGKMIVPKKTIENYFEGNFKKELALFGWKLFVFGSFFLHLLVINYAGFELYTNIHFSLFSYTSQPKTKQSNIIRMHQKCRSHCFSLSYWFFHKHLSLLNHIIDSTLCVLNMNSLNTEYTVSWQQDNRLYHSYSMHIVIER